MGLWTNSSQQNITDLKGQHTNINFDEELIPGSQTAAQSGIYAYAYHLNLIKPSGSAGPSRASAVMFVDRASGGIDIQRESRHLGIIDTGDEGNFGHTGDVILDVGDTVGVRINLFAHSEGQGGVFTRTKTRTCSLALDMKGVSSSGNSHGPSFPATAHLTSGYEWYRTDLKEKFIWDGTKWLGDIRSDGAGRTGSQAGNSYFRRYNGMLMTATRGIYIPWDATITCVSWTKGDSVTGNIELHRDGLSVGNVNANASGGGGDVDIDFAGGAVLSLFWASITPTSNVQITIHYRRRFPA